MQKLKNIKKKQRRAVIFRERRITARFLLDEYSGEERCLDECDYYKAQRD